MIAFRHRSSSVNRLDCNCNGIAAAAEIDAVAEALVDAVLAFWKKNNSKYPLGVEVNVKISIINDNVVVVVVVVVAVVVVAVVVAVASVFVSCSVNVLPWQFVFVGIFRS